MATDQQTFRPGDRVVWTSSAPASMPTFSMAGTYLADGPAPFVTVRHDGWDHDAQVYADQLTPGTSS